MDIEKEIQGILAAKSGNKEMAIFYDGDKWLCMLGNQSEYVMLGEINGEIEAEGDSFKEVIQNMRIKMGLATL